MLRVILYSVVCFLAVFGFLQFIVKSAERLLKPETPPLLTPYTVMAVKNREEDIETLIRAEAWRMLCGNSNRQVGDIVVIDLESEDETLSVLRKLSREYEFLHPLTRERYIEMIQNL